MVGSREHGRCDSTRDKCAIDITKEKVVHDLATDVAMLNHSGQQEMCMRMGFGASLFLEL
ncbi:uncharacterized protein PHALS_13354 [Plasmopara halstedii]|uniref:Uncharacterized protein n=1 Tax=Plasmopara halstedii TaxID=4781 RepID=A0A0P1AQ13_PLAHL|nr:uncharacterized protein PHALS_13354 [Plasmopara halstedii]CEG43138.1 hypothetical protein PHALS_13354 [Plasmopara halstedii]|eukprot:XP_024579507.1 hypothetical protein PHALS_13354 [Plasmopara halstedii]